MENIVRELYGILKAHNEDVNKWMLKLRQWKTLADSETGFKLKDPYTWVTLFKSRQVTKTTDKEDISKPNCEYENLALVTQDTKLKIEVLAKNVEHFLEQMDKSIPKLPDKEKRSQPIVQIYDRGNYAADFVSSFTQKFKKQFNVTDVQKVADIDKCNPLLILCTSMSRVDPDLNYAVEEFESLNDFQAAIIIIHCKTKHALPQTSSELQVSGLQKYKNIALIDVAFTKELKFYECDMNSKASKRLEDFVLRS